MNDQPSGAGGHDPQHQGYPGQQGYPPQAYPQQGAYPDHGGFPAPIDYPPSQGNYPSAGVDPAQQGAPPPYGSYPPPPGAYAQYPQAQYPQAQYPQPGQWGYGGPPLNVAPPELRAGAAIAYGWKKFVANIGVWLGFMGLYGAVLVVFYVVFVGILFATLFSSSAFENSNYGADYDTSGITATITIGSALVGVLSYFAGAVLIRGALLELDGARPTFGSFWRLRNVANIAIYAVLLAVINAATSALGNVFVAIAVGIVVGIMFWFVLQLLLDRGLPFHEAVIANATLLARAPGQLALLLLGLGALNVAGGLLCGLGLVFTVPTSLIAMSYAYRVLSGGFVSPPT